jgi:23S rRNA (guanosine2251-2'-O)-methyltransferase
MKKKEAILILENIRSAQNVGALFRTADAAGISKIFLVGYTPDPVDRFNRARGDIAKAALGAEKTIVWEHAKTIAPLLKKLRKEGCEIIAIEQAESSVDYKRVARKARHPKTAFILGNEVSGVSKQAFSLSDIVAEIPMKGKKESLNVSVAGGIALFRMLNI